MKTLKLLFAVGALLMSACASAAVQVPVGALYTQGNHIYANGRIWMGRGANMFDVRSNGACYDKWYKHDPTYEERVGHVKKLVDTLVDDWHANFIRLTLETHRGDYQYSVVNDSNYLRSIVAIVDYIGTKRGVQVIVTPWLDPSKNLLENMPNEALGILSIDPLLLPAGEVNQGGSAERAPYYTSDVLSKLVRALWTRKHVVWGLGNEPTNGGNATMDNQVWHQHNNLVRIIRDEESALGSFPHVISVPGTRGWARDVNYYVKNPITAGRGINIAYEAHLYNAAADFPYLVTTPAKTLPLVIGEFGPTSGIATIADATKLMALAESLQIPFAGWTFSGKSPGWNMISDSNTKCDFTYADGIVPTPDWGVAVRNFLLSHADSNLTP